MTIEVSMSNMNYKIIGEGIPVLLIHGFCLDNNVMKGAYEPIFRKIDGDSAEKEGLKAVKIFWTV